MKNIITQICVFILKKMNVSVVLHCDITMDESNVFIGMNDGGIFIKNCIVKSENIKVYSRTAKINFVTICKKFSNQAEDLA